MASSLGHRLSRDDFRKAKELEELRKTGAAPPELDEEGKMINPHIPQYISAAPWYLGVDKPGLKHQYNKLFKEDDPSKRTKRWYQRGTFVKRASKFRKGACSNCGSMTHKKVDCVERPRRRGAQLTGKDIAPDELVEELHFDYDGKRDRWNGYDPRNHAEVIKLFEKTEEARRKKKTEELDQELNEGEVSKAKRRKLRHEVKEANKQNAVDSSDSDSDSDASEDSDQGGEKHDLRARTTAPNLRIREDTAKYLLNLDPNSAHYDPKTRSMRENPHEGKTKDDVLYAGENWVRGSGQVQDLQKLERFVWDAAERGGELNLVGNPSQAEKMHQEFMKKQQQTKGDKRAAMLAKYGGSEHLQTPEAVLNVQSEAYVEYASDGTVMRGREEAIPKTKYTEDSFLNNHSAVWGSFWKDGKWGFACCHQTMRSAYCTGSAGRRALRQEEERTQRTQPRGLDVFKVPLLPKKRQRSNPTA